MAQVAQRHEVTRQQICARRDELKRKGLWSPDTGALFVPTGMAPVAELPVAGPAPVAWIELRPAKGRTLRFESGIGDAAPARLIRAVDAA